MKSATRHSITALGLIILMSFLTACGKKCPQQQAGTVLQTFTNVEWRLIRTTDPAMANAVTPYTFISMVFKSEFSGELYRFVNNKKYTTPVYTFQYSVSSRGTSGTMAIAYTAVTPSEDGTEDPSVNTNQPTTTSRYSYSLSRGFTLKEATKGYVYEFIPFEGIIDPDNNCTF